VRKPVGVEVVADTAALHEMVLSVVRCRLSRPTTDLVADAIAVQVVRVRLDQLAVPC
jgi:hypothetical protein